MSNRVEQWIGRCENQSRITRFDTATERFDRTLRLVPLGVDLGLLIQAVIAIFVEQFLKGLLLRSLSIDQPFCDRQSAQSRQAARLLAVVLLLFCRVSFQPVHIPSEIGR